jgi:hypothetical protein
VTHPDKPDKQDEPKQHPVFSWEIKIGDLLTVTTILISLISVLISWNVDRKIGLTKDANAVRDAAANTLGDLERWRNTKGHSV